MRHALHAGLALLLAGCDTPAPGPADAMAAFRAGTATLHCVQPSCARRWDAALPLVRNRLAAGDAEAAALLILAADFDENGAWYHLGLAAEQAGHAAAARRYHRLATLLSADGPPRNCLWRETACGGVPMPAAAQARLAALAPVQPGGGAPVP